MSPVCRLLAAAVLILGMAGPPAQAAADFLHDFDLPAAPERAPSPPRPRSLDDVLNHYGPMVRPTLRQRFLAAGVPWPPRRLTLIGLKAERQLEVWAYVNDEPRFIHSYPVLDASGLPGPKRRRGDHQVPEGIYRVDAFNPNSRFHLSMRINYPNEFDRLMGLQDGRDNLGYDIFIHGRDYSEGCLAIGDPAIEELFVLVVDAGFGNTEVVIVPHDPRRETLLPPARGLPAWVDDLYLKLEQRLAAYRLEPLIDVSRQIATSAGDEYPAPAEEATVEASWPGTGSSMPGP